MFSKLFKLFYSSIHNYFCNKIADVIMVFMKEYPFMLSREKSCEKQLSFSKLLMTNWTISMTIVNFPKNSGNVILSSSIQYTDCQDYEKLILSRRSKWISRNVNHIRLHQVRIKLLTLAFEKSPEVQHRIISGPTKGHVSANFFKKRISQK